MIRLFGEIGGEAVHEISIGSPEGAEAKIITYGAAVRDLLVPFRVHKRRVVLGLNSAEAYRDHSPYFGAIAGRVANRIGGGRFTLDGVAHQASRNERGNCLHGGALGFSRRLWRIADHDARSAALTLVSRDGDQGFPGTLTTTCVYRLTGSTLRIELSATTDAPTVVNLCHHSYFNLDDGPSILDHTLRIAADFHTPVDGDLIPTGEIRPVANTPYDFRKERPIRFSTADGGPFGYDINFVLNRAVGAPSGFDGLPLAHAATLCAGEGALAVWTTEPGLQIYDGERLDVPVPGLGGVRYGPNGGICLETQHFPDSPNRNHFPSITLRPDGVYRHITEYRFMPR